ncbi:MAG: hypothetical protein JXB32_22420 [Deltaproteobacteria bacterium]|nr:hypothetical protein [Deltaproteobacteria bacterium]
MRSALVVVTLLGSAAVVAPGCGDDGNGARDDAGVDDVVEAEAETGADTVPDSHPDSDAASDGDADAEPDGDVPDPDADAEPDGDAPDGDGGVPPCTDDTDCTVPNPSPPYADGSTQICLDEVCVAGCREAADCAPSHTCDPTTNRCVMCLSDTDCTLPNPSPPYQRGTSEICEDYLCTAGCRLDVDCLLGYICQERRCVEGCRTDRDCSTPLKCVDLICRRLCTTNADCRSTPATPICDTHSALCVECMTNSDCLRHAPERPVCDMTTHACGCAADADCSAFPHAAAGICDVASDVCIGCRTDADCIPGFSCDTDHACV